MNNLLELLKELVCHDISWSRSSNGSHIFNLEGAIKTAKIRLEIESLDTELSTKISDILISKVR